LVEQSPHRGTLPLQFPRNYLPDPAAGEDTQFRLKPSHHCPNYIPGLANGARSSATGMDPQNRSFVFDPDALQAAQPLPELAPGVA
jgi:hypothetical protein